MMCRNSISGSPQKDSGGQVLKSGMEKPEEVEENGDVVVYFSQKPCTSDSFHSLVSSERPSKNDKAANAVSSDESLTSSINDDVTLSLPRKYTDPDSLPAYLQPDPYEGLVEKVRVTMKNTESDVSEAKRLMMELQRKAERLLPGGLIRPTDLGFVRAVVGPCSNDAMSSEQHLGTKSLKSVTCEVCGLCFASVQTKVRHAKRLHPNELDKISTSTYDKCLLSHECSVCHKAFATVDQVNTHRRRRHESERAFACSVCDRAYTVPSELNKHMKRVHGIASGGRQQKRAGSKSLSGTDSLASRPSSRSTYDGSDDMPDL